MELAANLNKKFMDDIARGVPEDIALKRREKRYRRYRAYQLGKQKLKEREKEKPHEIQTE